MTMNRRFAQGNCRHKGRIGGRVRYFNGALRLQVVAEVTRKGSAQFSLATDCDQHIGHATTAPRINARFQIGWLSCYAVGHNA